MKRLLRVGFTVPFLCPKDSFGREGVGGNPTTIIDKSKTF